MNHTTSLRDEDAVELAEMLAEEGAPDDLDDLLAAVADALSRLSRARIRRRAGS